MKIKEAVILAAGKGTRLHPVTLKRSKAMAPIVGKPMIERVMETFIVNGIDKFTLVVSDEDEDIRPYFERIGSPEIHIQFVVQPERLGMAHALQLATPYIEGPFIVSACDNIVPEHHVAALLQRHETKSAKATLSLMELSDAQVQRSSAVAWQDGEITQIIEKPTLDEAPSNIGSLPLYLFAPLLLDYLPRLKPSLRGEYELQDAIQLIIQEQGGVTGVLTKDRVQLTNIDDLCFLNRHYLAKTDSNHLRPTAIGPNTQLITPLRIEAETKIGPNCVIGPNVSIEACCQIGTNVILREAVILRAAVIDDGETIENTVIA